MLHGTTRPFPAYARPSPGCFPPSSDGTSQNQAKQVLPVEKNRKFKLVRSSVERAGLELSQFRLVRGSRLVRFVVLVRVNARVVHGGEVPLRADGATVQRDTAGRNAQARWYPATGTSWTEAPGP